MLKRLFVVFCVLSLLFLSGFTPALSLPPGSTLSVNDVTVVEGDDGPVAATFTVSLFPSRGPKVTVDYATFSGTADTNDYFSASGTLVFEPDDRSPKSIVVAVKGDLFDEEDTETFNVRLSNPANALLLDDSGTGTINDNDVMPAINISDVEVTEEDGTYSQGISDITLSAPSNRRITVNYATVPSSAASQTDFVPLQGTIELLPGETKKQLTVFVEPDLIDELDESFAINLSSAVNATLGDPSGRVTIHDNDPLPTLSIADSSASESTVGSSQMVFPVSLSEASGKPITVHYASAAGTATEAIDYIGSSGSITFAPGERIKQITIGVLSDVLDEDDEILAINLTNATNAVVGDGSGEGVILDDDQGPSLTVGDVTIQEYNVTPKPAPSVTEDFEDTSILFPVTGSWQRSNITAKTGSYAFKAGSSSPGKPSEATFTVNFPPESTSRRVSLFTKAPQQSGRPCEYAQVEVFLNGNLVGVGGCNSWAEVSSSSALVGDNTLLVRFRTIYYSNPGNAFIDDMKLTYSMPVDPVIRLAHFQVTLSQPSGRAVSTSFRTLADTAAAGSDFTHSQGTVTFSPGETSKTIDIETLTDDTDETDESFTLELYDSVNAELSDALGQATILDDDDPSAISLGDVTVTEGTGGVQLATIPVSLDRISSFEISASWSTQDGTAKASEDLEASSGVVTIPAGQRTTTITVPITTDASGEYDETFLVRLSSSTNSMIGRSPAVVTIDNDDLFLMVSDTSGLEWDEGGGTGASSPHHERVVYIQADPVPQTTFTVKWSTKDGTATAEEDYRFVFGGSGVVELGPGRASAQVWTYAYGDLIDEADETYYVEITDSSGVQVLDSLGAVTLIDDDPIDFTTWEFGNDEGSTVYGLIIASRPTDTTLQVLWETAGERGTATPGADYVPLAGAGTISEFNSHYEFSIPTIDDPLCEDFFEWIPITFEVPPVGTGNFWIAILDNEAWGSCL